MKPKAKAKPAAPPKPKTAKVVRGAFPKKNQPPSPAEFSARLPMALGKRFEGVRTFLLKQKGVSEDVYFYGPRAGWALRYLRRTHPLCSLLILDEQPLGILSLDTVATASVDWTTLSPVAQEARKAAHGSPNQLWLDVPIDGPGAADFKTLIKAKIATLPALPPPPPPPAAPKSRLN